MSRGFVKEGDQEEVPLVPPRAHLPAGVTNYVTPAGMDELFAEQKNLLAEKDQLNIDNEDEKRIAVNHINALLQQLNERIAEARVVDLRKQPTDEVRFGAIVTLKTEGNQSIQAVQIVGVDEANVTKGKISFLSPLARVILNKKKGDRVVLKLPFEERTLEIMDISYES